MIIRDEVIQLQTSSGSMQTYVYAPHEQQSGFSTQRKFPALVLFSEIFQQTGPIRRMAQTLAGHGVLVAVPEIFHELEPAGTVLSYDQAGADRGNQHKTGKTVAAYDEDARAVIEFLAAEPRSTGNVGAMGICIGGHLAFRAAMHPLVLSSACFYATDIHKSSLGTGSKDDSLARIGEIRGELLMIWGKQDPHISPEGRELIQQRLSQAQTIFSWHEFNAAHAFMRDEGPRYDPELAMHCYNLALRLFARTLQ